MWNQRNYICVYTKGIFAQYPTAAVIPALIAAHCFDDCL